MEETELQHKNLERDYDIYRQRVDDTLSLVQLADKYGLTKQRVSQIEHVMRRVFEDYSVPMRTCEVCSKSFTKYLGQKFCSKACWAISQKEWKESPEALAVRKQKNEQARLERKAAWLASPSRLRPCATPGCPNMVERRYGGKINHKYCGSFSNKTGCSYANQRRSGLFQRKRACKRCGIDITHYPRLRARFCGEVDYRTDKGWGCIWKNRIELAVRRRNRLYESLKELGYEPRRPGKDS